MEAAPRAGSRRELQPGEMAAAATMAAVCIGLDVLGSLLPGLGVLQLLTVVPFGVVAHRHGLRALVAALVAAAVVAGLVAGLGSAIGLVLFAVLGGLVGELKRRERGVGALWAAAAVLAPLAAAVVDVLLLIFASSRVLVLQNMRSTVRGVGSVLRHVASLDGFAAGLNRATSIFIAHWALCVALVVAGAMLILLLISWQIIGEVLDRLRWVGSLPLGQHPEHSANRPEPVPVELRRASFRYGALEALRDVDLRIAPGEFVAVVGDNGSGKSTLARLLAGATPSGGTVERPGPVGLGRAGGTALIGQRPDTQVLGLRVRDDILWGLSADDRVDVESLLETVGLQGMASRDTASLSGGELQRVAVAAALARRPQLLISDESTAMVDAEGRVALLRLLAELPRVRAMSVVHITHNEDELAEADRVVRLEHGRVVSNVTRAELAREASTHAELVREGSAHAEPVREGSVHAEWTSAANQDSGSPGGSYPRISVSDLEHRYAHGTVWEHRALDGLTLSVEAGEGVLIVGANGSGKSTLAWIMAGLMEPTAGACLVDGVPSHRLRGTVGLAFQHARLQLQRPTVAAEIADAAGWPRETRSADPPADGLRPELVRRVVDALSAVGLDPALADRSIEQLSGGQQRRVAIAGLLAREPSVLVLDEPLAGLDAPSRTGLVALLGELRRNRRMTLIVVTHDPQPLREVCPRTIRLDRGRIIEDTGRLDLASTPEARAA